MHPLTYGDIKTGADRIRGLVRPVTVAQLDPGSIVTAPVDPLDDRPDTPARVYLALEFMQHTGSFKARGAANFLVSHHEAGTLPEAGVAIASGGNAGLACAWAARMLNATATVFLPDTAPSVKVDKLRDLGAAVYLIPGEYADAARACEVFAAESGALQSHAYDHPLIAAGAGTLVDEIREQIPDLDTIVVAVGGGGLFAGVAIAAQAHGIRTIAVEPENCRALNAAIQVGGPVDVTVDSIAADSLGARRTSELALNAYQASHAIDSRSAAHSILVPDSEIVRARQLLWSHRRLLVEHGAATALAGLLAEPSYRVRDGITRTDLTPVGGYRPQPGETVCVVLCGANTDPKTI
ncbi:threonine/serine dehydratase [Streptacidiphilus sp. MAP5-52]|uniref:threonine/serine dehydratase n=1 Tax=Streptacidiphilus sp. MAP5-52 TaxID=3156267 RepID=UPI0035174E84